MNVLMARGKATTRIWELAAGVSLPAAAVTG